MNLSFRLYAFALTVVALSGCASQGKPPPSISLDEPVQAQPLPEPPAPVEVVAMPEPLALPAQLKPLHE
nr:P-type conjugative transfer protein TrbG [Enterobacter hormaechei]